MVIWIGLIFIFILIVWGISIMVNEVYYKLKEEKKQPIVVDFISKFLDKKYKTNLIDTITHINLDFIISEDALIYDVDIVTNRVDKFHNELKLISKMKTELCKYLQEREEDEIEVEIHIKQAKLAKL